KGSIGLTGKEAEETLDSVGITCNKNTIPFDQEKPFVTSGIRLGTPAATTRGFDEKAFEEVAKIISLALKNSKDEEKLQQAKERVAKLTAEYPLYQ
ncbi:TPA: serine hydroxymethyltransferase, partial [Staphylococcus aureus]|nr:serine hydroxymethyltransferase [Staphylococcus aureus]